MNSALLKRLEKVEQAMNPPKAPPRPRIVIAFIRPEDGTVSSRRVFGPDEPIGGRRIFGPDSSGEDDEDDSV